MNKFPIVMLAIAALSPPSLAHGQQAVTTDKLTGTWKLLSFYDESVISGKKINVFGDNPRGYMIFTPDQRTALVYASILRAAPKSPPPTDAEAAGLFKTMLAYIAKYEIDPAPPTAAGTKMIIRAEIASNPLIEGADRGFFVRVDGNKLVFKTNPPARSPLTGEVSTRNVVLEREP